MRVRDPQVVQVPTGRGCLGWLADGGGLGGNTNGAWTCRPWLPRAPGRSGVGGVLGLACLGEEGASSAD